ncbi:MAG: hypothetical protein RML36_16270 [Anaerolineae bacterium]|nr:hypothetical protein [Anaerolineae bacterium]
MSRTTSKESDVLAWATTGTLHSHSMTVRKITQMHRRTGAILFVPRRALPIALVKPREIEKVEGMTLQNYSRVFQVNTR